MKEETTRYRFLIHCNIHQIREGFEANIKSLPFHVDTHYANLQQEGIMNELKFAPDLIVVLQYECDSDFLLPLKVRLFAPDVPLLVVLPSIPGQYYRTLRLIGVEHIVQLPADDETLCNTIAGILGA